MKKYLLIAALSGLLAVILGAFGAHGLKAQIPDVALDSYKTGVAYQFYHTFALFIAMIIYKLWNSALFKTAALFFSLGILFFSGSIYILSTGSLWLSHIPAFIGPITPIGGLFFITGWILLFLGIIKKI